MEYQVSCLFFNAKYHTTFKMSSLITTDPSFQKENFKKIFNLSDVSKHLWLDSIQFRIHSASTITLNSSGRISELIQLPTFRVEGSSPDQSRYSVWVSLLKPHPTQVWRRYAKGRHRSTRADTGLVPHSCWARMSCFTAANKGGHHTEPPPLSSGAHTNRRHPLALAQNTSRNRVPRWSLV